MEQRRGHFWTTLLALSTAALLHLLVGYLLFSSQTLQFSHASAAQASAERGVAVTLVSTPRSTLAPAPTAATSPPAPKAVAASPRPLPATTQRSELPLASAATPNPNPNPNASATSSSAHPSPSAAPPTSSPAALAEPTTSRRETDPSVSAPSSQAASPTLPGAAAADSEALACRIPQPPYPPRAKRLRQTGTVTLRLTVTASGAVTGAEVARSSGSESLDQAALDAVSAAKCKPGLTDGVASAVVVAIPVHFSLLN